MVKCGRNKTFEVEDDVEVDVQDDEDGDDEVLLCSPDSNFGTVLRV